jgi:hypothetical protein
MLMMRAPRASAQSMLWMMLKVVAAGVLSETPHWYCLGFSHFLGANHNRSHYRLWY